MCLVCRQSDEDDREEKDLPEHASLADLALPEDISPAFGAMEALEVARAAWARVHQQMSLEL